MISAATKKRKIYLFLYLLLCGSFQAQDIQASSDDDDTQREESISKNQDADNVILSDQFLTPVDRTILQKKEQVIRSIIIKNNRLVSQESILVRLPYKPGEIFKPNI